MLSGAAMSLPRPLQPFADYLANAWEERAIALKAVSFAAVGVINTLVDASVFFLAYAFVVDSLIVANVLAWMAGVTCSYTLNSYTTFAAESGRKLRLASYGAFVLSGLVGLVANTSTLLFVAQSLEAPVWVAKACAILVSFVVNFSITNFVVFRKR